MGGLKEYFERWAMEYKKSADRIREQIEKLESCPKKHRGVEKTTCACGIKRLEILHEMYGDCMCRYRELMKKAEDAVNSQR